MIDNRGLILKGMRVVDADGQALGTVKEIHAGDFLLERRLARDLYVPLDAVRASDGVTLTLATAAERIDELDWANPPLLGAETTPSAPGGLLEPERGVWDPATDIVNDEPLDTVPGQTTTSGTDDGDVPPPAELLTREERRRRDLMG